MYYLTINTMETNHHETWTKNIGAAPSVTANTQVPTSSQPPGILTKIKKLQYDPQEKHEVKDPDIKVQVEVLNWFHSENKEVPEHFRSMIEGVSKSWIKTLCENKVREKLRKQV